MVKKELKFFQISNKTYALAMKNITGIQESTLLQRIKHYGGRWNRTINLYQIPLQNVPTFIDLLRKPDHLLSDILVQDAPDQKIKKVLCPKLQENQQNRMFYLTPRKKWNRILLYDPLLCLRFKFLEDFVYSPINQDKDNQVKEKRIHKRVLLLCSESKKLNWMIKFLHKSKQSLCKEINYEEFLPENLSKVHLALMFESECHLLTYQRLKEYGDIITAKVLQKYTTIICDDADTFFSQENAIYINNQYSHVLKLVLKERLPSTKDLVLIISNLNLSKTKEVLDLANLLKPKVYGIDMLQAISGEVNNVTWMKSRYKKENKMAREFYYILTTTILIVLPLIEKSNSVDHSQIFKNEIHKKADQILQYEDKIFLSLPNLSMQKFRAIDNKYKNLSRIQILKSFNSNRLKNSQIYSESSKHQEAKFLKDTRELMLNEKLPIIMNLIYKTVKQQNLRIAVVVESLAYQESMEKFFNQNQIQYCVYEIVFDCFNKNIIGYDKFNKNTKIKVLLLVRDKLLKEYKKAKLQNDQYIQQKFNRHLEQQLMIELGGVNEIQNKKERFMNQSQFGYEEDLQLAKIGTIKHLYFVDTFWQEYSQEKEKIIKNIFNVKLPVLKCSEVNQLVKSKESLSYLQANKLSESNYFTEIQLVKHYFIVKDSYQKFIFANYSVNNADLHQEQLSQIQMSRLNIHEGVKETVQSWFSKQMLKLNWEYKNNNKVGAVDIDDEFDRLQFLAMKEKQKKNQIFVMEDESTSRVRYNTHINGLQEETPCLRNQGEELNQQLKIFAKKSHLQLTQTDFIHQPSSESSSCDSSEIDISKYLIQSKPNSNQPKQTIQTDWVPSRQTQNKYHVKSQEIESEESKNNPMRNEEVLKIYNNAISSISIPPHKSINQKNDDIKVIDLQDGSHEEGFGKVNKKNHRNKMKKRTKVKYIAKRPIVTAKSNEIDLELARNTEGKQILWYKPHKDHAAQKIIAKKYKKLSVKLIPFKSKMISE